MGIAHLVDDKEIAKLRDTFEQLDTENKGTLPEKVLKDTCVKAGIRSQDFDKLCKGVLTEDNEINYSGWLAVNMKKQQYLKECYVWEAFRIFDKDGTGKISVQELEMMLSRDSPGVKNIQRRQTKQILDNFDKDKDG